MPSYPQAAWREPLFRGFAAGEAGRDHTAITILAAPRAARELLRRRPYSGAGNYECFFHAVARLSFGNTPVGRAEERARHLQMLHLLTASVVLIVSRLPSTGLRK